MQVFSPLPPVFCLFEPQKPPTLIRRRPWGFHGGRMLPWEGGGVVRGKGQRGWVSLCRSVFNFTGLASMAHMALKSRQPFSIFRVYQE